MNARFLLALLTLMLSSLSAVSIAAAAPQRVIVEKGQPRATIIVQRDQPKALSAATTLQTYIEKMTGAKLPIVVDGKQEARDGETLLLVGDTDRAKALKVAIPSGFDPKVRDDAFNEEGYVLKTVGNEIVVAGNNDGPYHGTIYGAYALLEKLGCRWFFPGEWGEDVPKLDTIAIEDLDVTSRPDFPARNIWLSGWVPMTAAERKLYSEWCTKIGFTEERMYPLVGDGFLGLMLPSKTYFATHPEYYALGKDGQRHIGRNDRETMLCLTNPEVLKQSIANLRDALSGKTKLANVSSGNGFGISPPDGTPMCYCDECQKQSQNFRYPTYVHEPMTSEAFFGFADKLAREFPDKFVQTMAYSLREMPPQGVNLPRNVAVLYAPISCDVLHANDSKLWRRAEYMRILSQWCQISPHVTLYEYNPGLLTGMFIPERQTANAAINFPIYKKLGVKGLAAEGRKAFMQTWTSYYVSAKLLWDSKADVAAIKKDFYTRFFGPSAGPSVQAWWDACEKQLGDSTMQAHEDFLINHIYTSEFVNSIRPLVDAAIAAEGTPVQKDRVAVFAMIADHLAAWATMNDAEHKLDYRTAADAAGKMVALQRKLHDAYPFMIDEDPKHLRPYFANGRQVAFEKLLAMRNGTTGTNVTDLPLEMKFTRDPFNQGVIAQWYAPGFDDSAWKTHDTFYLWEQQESPTDDIGHDYDGYGWYRDSIDIPADFKGKPVHFYSGGAINEAWVWVNGEYAGHKKHDLWWSHSNQFDLDVTNLVKPGEKNQITIRIWNDAELGGLMRRGFFYSPIAPTTQPK